MKLLTTVAALIAAVAIGCSLSVDEDPHNKTADVQVLTPAGNLSIRAGGEVPHTGLTLYPGATPLHDDERAEVADVTIGSSLLDIKVAAATFASEASPALVVGYYRKAMRVHGTVTECRGDIDFKGPRGSRRPICRGSLFTHDTQLVVGTEGEHRLVSVRRRGSGSEFSLVSVQTRGHS